MSDEIDHDWYLRKQIERPPDRKVEEAKKALLARFFPLHGTNVYYGRQLEVLLEREFFHWITKRALNELAREGNINFIEEATAYQRAHFYWPLRHRYPRRQIRASLNIIAEISSPSLTRAVGVHQELLADAGFARIGFRVSARNVREVAGHQWTRSGHDLDRLIERDNIRYGVEIKNELGYIGPDELDIKLSMCAHLGVRPMFVVRVMPETYISKVDEAGGFSLILGSQNYPPLAEALAERVRGNP